MRDEWAWCCQYTWTVTQHLRTHTHKHKHKTNREIVVPVLVYVVHIKDTNVLTYKPMRTRCKTCAKRMVCIHTDRAPPSTRCVDTALFVFLFPFVFPLGTLTHAHAKAQCSCSLRPSLFHSHDRQHRRVVAIFLFPACVYVTAHCLLNNFCC